MSKFYGRVGYATDVEVSPGVYEHQIVERNYYGDVMTNFRRLDTNNTINEGVDINNKFSIVADPFAYQNFYSIRYLEYMGTLWTITNVEVQSPRLILTAGGVYNGTQANTAK